MRSDFCRTSSDRPSVQGAARAARPSLLSADDELALAQRIKAGDTGAINQLVLANLKLVRAIVRDYKDCGLPLDDLLQEGNLGLVRASQDFDPVTYRKRFRTYASFWIRTSIHKALAANIPLVRCSGYVDLPQSCDSEAIDELADEVGDGQDDGVSGQGSLDEIAERLGVPVQALESARQAPLPEDPRLHRRDRGERVALDALPTASHPPESDLVNEESNELVHRALSRLNPFEAWVIQERYGFRERHPETKHWKSSGACGLSRKPRPRTAQARATTRER